MRNFTIKLSLIAIALFASYAVNAQSFKTSVESTDRFSGYIKPLRPNGSIQLQVKVKNNTADTTKVTLQKNAFGYPADWITIDTNDQTLFPKQESTFLLTIKVPSYEAEGVYPFFLNFYAITVFKNKSKENTEYTFNHHTAQTVVVDNSKPEAPSYTTSSTSTTIYVNSWQSFDLRSSPYTTYNQSSGIDGIESYTVSLINPDGSVKETKTIKATDGTAYTFKTLTPNTNYRVDVIAYDLVGNSNSTLKNTPTTPAKPTGLTFSNTTYASTTLKWIASSGANAYDVYLFANNSYTKVNSSPITNNYYTINSLSPNTTYMYNVIALGNTGSSDRSDNVSVTTLAPPLIIGSNILCSSSSYYLDNLISGYTVSWSGSSNIQNTSSYGNRAIFKKAGNGSAIVYAKISQNGINPFTISKTVWCGNPSFSLSGDEQIEVGSMGFAFISNSNSSISSINWSCSGAIYGISGGTTKAKYRSRKDGNGVVYANANNQCGFTEKRLFVNVTGGFRTYPNPVENNLNIEMIEAEINTNKHKKVSRTIDKTHLTITNSYGLIIMSESFKGKNHSLNVSNLSKGIYTVTIIKEDKKYSAKFIKQ